MVAHGFGCDRPPICSRPDGVFESARSQRRKTQGANDLHETIAEHADRQDGPLADIDNDNGAGGFYFPNQRRNGRVKVLNNVGFNRALRQQTGISKGWCKVLRPAGHKLLAFTDKID